MIHVRLYDNFNFMPAFFIAGFEKLAALGEIRLHYTRGAHGPIPDAHKAEKMLVFSVRDADDRVRSGAVDIFDNYQSIRRETLNYLHGYFKFNYNAGWIAANLHPDDARIIHPIGFHVPVYLDSWFGMRNAARWAQSAWFSRAQASVRQRVTTVREAVFNWRDGSAKTARLADYQRYRGVTQFTTDVFWNVTYWREQYEASGTASRERVALIRRLRALAETHRFNMRAGFIDRPDAREDVPDLILADSPRYGAYIEAVGTAKLTLVTPGIHQCFSYRVAEQLAMGRFLFMQRHINQTAVPLQDGVHAVFFEPDLSDFDDKLVYYLTHDAEREAIARAGAAHFDAVYAPEQQARQMIARLLDG